MFGKYSSTKSNLSIFLSCTNVSLQSSSKYTSEANEGIHLMPLSVSFFQSGSTISSKMLSFRWPDLSHNVASKTKKLHLQNVRSQLTEIRLPLHSAAAIVLHIDIIIYECHISFNLPTYMYPYKDKARILLLDCFVRRAY